MKQPWCTCIIPVYNEENGVVNVLKKIAKIKHFNEVIIINDGSKDNSLKNIQKFIKTNSYKHIRIISYKKNKGKTHAIYQGIKKVKTAYVCTFDSDLKNIYKKEIIYMIEHMYKNSEIDMGILRRMHAKRYIKIFYRELILSGQRIMKTKDIKEVFKEKFEKYQLEVAINTFMEKNRKTTVRYPFSGENTPKRDKRWLFTGIKKDINMFRDIFKYQGIIGYIKHSFSFSPINEKKYSTAQKRKF